MPVPQRLHAQWLALQPSRVAKDSMGQCMPKDAGPPEPGADDGTIEAAITGEEVLRLREIFNKIADEESSDGQKALSVHELLHMAALLGEPHTEAEAGEAIEHFHEVTTPPPPSGTRGPPPRASSVLIRLAVNLTRVGRSGGVGATRSPQHAPDMSVRQFPSPNPPHTWALPDRGLHRKQHRRRRRVRLRRAR